MKQFVTLSTAALVLAIGAAVAQTPYAGMETRSIKALSDQQIADLRAGRGMGLALAAELNGYPGPSHLLELADKLGLSDAQRDSARNMFAAMKAETAPIGERLIAQEAALDRLFADRAITREKLSAATAEIGATQAELRVAHLKYHLSTVAMLEPSQIQQYSALRGYDNVGSQEHHHHH
jgi:Spy/CpxP family protein refolding chaperone